MSYFCNLSIIPVRKTPSDTSEMVNQLLYGDEVIIKETQNNWCLIESILDGYIGWVDKKQIIELNNWKPNYRVIQPIFKFNNVAFTQKLFLAGSYIMIDDNDSTEIRSFIGKSVVPFEDKLNSSITSIAMQFIDAPYLWGGKSIFGIDCSGLTQLVFKIAGKNILRDASQQATEGVQIENFNSLTSGDLVFFNKDKSNKVTHVGIVLIAQNQTKIIHASGKVKIDTLTPEGIIDENGQLTHHYLFTRRIYN